MVALTNFGRHGKTAALQLNYFYGPWIYLLLGKPLHNPNVCLHFLIISTKKWPKKNSASQIFCLKSNFVNSAAQGENHCRNFARKQKSLASPGIWYNLFISTKMV